MFDRDYAAERIGCDHFDVGVALEGCARKRHLCIRARRARCCCRRLGFLRLAAIAAGESEPRREGHGKTGREDARELSGHNSLHDRPASILAPSRARVHSSPKNHAGSFFNSSASRSGVRPARSFCFCSAGRCSCHASRSRTVVSTVRNRRPLATARAELTSDAPANSPLGGDHVVSSPLSSNLFSSRNFSGAQRNVVFAFVTRLLVSSRSPIVTAPGGLHRL